MSSGEILIVDDNPENLDLLVELLERHEYQIRVARNGRRALTASAASPPDLILLDINMPEMDGYEVCRRLKEAEATQEIPIIFLSINDDVIDKVQAFNVGGCDYVTKPFQAGEVLARIENQLKIARLQKALVASHVDAHKAREEAIAANRAKSLFLASISHELRTPLNGILGFVQLMERDEDLSEKQRENLAIIMRSGEHLLGIINDVLSISKIESGQMVLAERITDLSRLLLGLEEMFTIRAQAQGLHLLFEVPATIPRHVLCDDGKLRQILINLLGNAFKFTDSGGVALRVRWEDGVGYFEVEDTGTGIPETDLERIFDPFVQTKNGGYSSEGTGLGLTITRNFARLMGGDVTVRSEVGHGATFHVHVAMPVATRLNVDRDMQTVVGLEDGEPAYKILVVDDKRENRQVLATLLPSLGFDVREAANGREAVDMWTAWNPDLIFLDMHMPEMDGYQATRHIRESGDARAKVKIVALSASVFERDRQGILLAGCDDFVGKPFRQEVIFQKLVEHLGVRFRYAEPPIVAAARPHTALTPEMFAQMTSTQREALIEAITSGDRETAYDVANELAAHDEELSTELKALIKAYRFDEILELAQEK